MLACLRVRLCRFVALRCGIATQFTADGGGAAAKFSSDLRWRNSLAFEAVYLVSFVVAHPVFNSLHFVRESALENTGFFRRRRGRPVGHLSTPCFRTF